MNSRQRAGVEEHMRALAEYLYPGKGKGDKKRLKLESKEIYRMYV